MARSEPIRHPHVDGYRELADRFGEGRLADALLEKWLADPAGGEGFSRLQAMIDVDGARLSHFDELDRYTADRFDSYVRPTTPEQIARAERRLDRLAEIHGYTRRVA